MHRLLTLIICSAFLNGCASIHSGNYAEENHKSDGSFKGKTQANKSGLLISGQEIRQNASQYLTSFDFTFENTTSKWIRVKGASLDFKDVELNSKIKVVVGADLEAWSEANQQNAEISKYNNAMAFGLIMAGGALAANSKNSGLSLAGTTAAAGGATALTVLNFRNRINELERAKLVPSSHLYSEDFVVPPGMHSKKWVTIYAESPNEIPYVEKVTVTYTLENGKTESATVAVRRLLAPSKWQQNHPAAKAAQKTALDKGQQP